MIWTPLPNGKSLRPSANWEPAPEVTKAERIEMEVTEMRFENLLDAVEWAEEDIKDGFEIIRDKDNTYVVREVL